MLRLLLLTFLLTLKVSATDAEGSGDFTNDDEPGDEEETEQRISETFSGSEKNMKVEYDTAESDDADGSTTIIIIAAVCVVALAIVAIIAVVLFKRHLQRREQGVYSVPVDQDQKCI